jgi:hypothetical protein
MQKTIIPRAPRTSRQKSGQAWLIGDSDLAIARVLYRYDRLNTSVIAALAGIKKTTAQERLTRFRNETQSESEHYVRVETPSYNNENIYFADSKLAALIKSHGTLPYRATLLSLNGGSGLAHDLMVATVTANIELGMRGTPHSLVAYEEIMASPDFPQKDTNARRSFCIPVDTLFDCKPVRFDLIPDNIFGIEGPRGITFFALECENENTIETSQYKRNSTKRKMIGYRAISQRVNGVPHYTRHWGIPNLMVMFVAPTDAHVASMQTTLAKITGPNGSQQFLFRTADIMRDRPPYRSPQVDVGLFDAWKRIGNPPYELNQFSREVG